VNSYEVLAPGYHSPLTKTQIAELFYAGRLRRDHRCKQVSQKQWRTIDELFPLLKYQSAGPPLYSSSETEARSARSWILIIAFLAAAGAVVALWFYFSNNTVQPANRPGVTMRNWPRTITTAPNIAATVPEQDQISKTSPGAPLTIYAVPTTEAARPPVDLRQAQLAEQQRQTEERRREQTERDRLRAERERLEQKVAGQDVIIPLDEYVNVSVGGTLVSMKIHDNDVTSFDVWINGGWHRAVPKQKGIPHSGTDETLIYGAGRARLYYVWEPSGKVNHCLLRVRED
jgi:hypothetical protein